MDQIYKELKKFGDVKANESLAKHTTFKIGGPARFFVITEGAESLVNLLNYLRENDLEHFILAGGSNILMSDNGFDGVVVKITSKTLPQPVEHEGGYLIECESGTMLGALVNVAAKNELTGLEWAVGIPGTFGGAIRGNAGAMGKEIATFLKWVEIWRDGEVARTDSKDCGFSYRDSAYKHNSDIVLKGCIYLEKGDPNAIISEMQNHLKTRMKCRYPSAGSFFKNVKINKWPGDIKVLPELFQQRGTVPVGWLTDQLNLRGFKIGGAKIAEDHGNYIVNVDKATQADVLALVEEMKEKIYNKFGVELEPEVEVVK